jgi:hypothetical protein
VYYDAAAAASVIVVIFSSSSPLPSLPTHPAIFVKNLAQVQVLIFVGYSLKNVYNYHVGDYC